MSVISVFKQRKKQVGGIEDRYHPRFGRCPQRDYRQLTFPVGKNLGEEDTFWGMIQAVVLALVTLLTLINSSWLREKLPSYHVETPFACTLIGACMGVLSTFHSIGC